jgi:uncharacterized membrane protein YhaH (DUF805 family)
MGPAQAIRTAFAKSFQYSGRASRSEFWWFAAFWLVFPEVIGFIIAFPIGFRQGFAQATGEIASAPPDFYWANLAPDWTWLVLMVPGLAVISRRLRDTSRSPFWLLVPLPSAVLLISLMITGGIVTHAGSQTFSDMGKQVGAHWWEFVLISSLPLFWFLSRPSTHSPNPSEAFK